MKSSVTEKEQPVKISIIIPVYKEEKIINALLSHLVSITAGTEAEIIISDGDREAGTICSIEKKYLCLKNIKTIKSPMNRGIQMNTAAKSAEGGILLFLHADTFLSERAYGAVRAYMKEHTAGAFLLSINSRKLRYRIIERFINIRTRFTSIPYGDQALFIRKEYFLSLNGFFTHPVMEDIDLMRRIKKRGDRVFISDYRVRTSCRRWEREGVIKCTLRNWYIFILYYLGKDPDCLAKYYHYENKSFL